MNGMRTSSLPHCWDSFNPWKSVLVPKVRKIIRDSLSRMFWVAFRSWLGIWVSPACSLPRDTKAESDGRVGAWERNQPHGSAVRPVDAYGVCGCASAACVEGVCLGSLCLLAVLTDNSAGFVPLLVNFCDSNASLAIVLTFPLFIW